MAETRTVAEISRDLQRAWKRFREGEKPEEEKTIGELTRELDEAWNKYRAERWGIEPRRNAKNSGKNYGGLSEEEMAELGHS